MEKWYTCIVKIKNIKTYKTESKKITEQQYRKITTIVLYTYLQTVVYAYIYDFFSYSCLICMVQILTPDMKK